jgi:hypothetical protein
MGKIQIIIFTTVFALILQMILPWWSVAIAAFLVSVFFTQSRWQAFANGFIGIFVLWLVWSGTINYLNDGILSERLSELLMLPHSVLAIVATALIGGITGGFASLTGNLFRSLIRI